MHKPLQNIQPLILQYKMAKVNSLLRKIKHTFLSEGLDLKQLPQFLTQSLNIHRKIHSDPILNKEKSQRCNPVDEKQNSSKLTGEMMFALCETYQDLLRKLDENYYFYPLRKIEVQKQAVLKFEEIDNCNQQSKCTAGLLKIEQTVRPQNQSSLEGRSQTIKKLKKELINKRKQIKMLKAQFQSTKTQATGKQKPARRQSKRSRKAITN